MKNNELRIQAPRVSVISLPINAYCDTHVFAPEVRIRLITFALALSVVCSLQAQKEPQRPKLPAGADTNDARAYVTYGDDAGTPWNKSHDAYYWAWRIEPNQTAYLYAVYIALYERQPVQWREEFESGNARVLKSNEARQLDSLFPQVLARDPFPRFGGSVCRIPPTFPEDAKRLDDLSQATLYARFGCHLQAAERYDAYLRLKPERWGWHLDRARALYFAQRYPEAAAEIQIVLDTLRKRDEKYVRRFYYSKETLEHMIAVSHLAAGNLAGAREAYGRALTENLSFFTAHHGLAGVAKIQGKIEEALSEYDLAVQLKGEDGVLRYDYGTALLDAKRFDQAEVQLRKAVELEPHWAYARHNLALALDNQGKHADAITEYNAFIARAPRRLGPQVERIRTRVKALSQEDN